MPNSVLHAGESSSYLPPQCINTPNEEIIMSLPAPQKKNRRLQLQFSIFTGPQREWDKSGRKKNILPSLNANGLHVSPSQCAHLSYCLTVIRPRLLALIKYSSKQTSVQQWRCSVFRRKQHRMGRYLPSIGGRVLERTLLPALSLSPSALAFDPNAVKVRAAAADKQAPGGQLHVAVQIAVLFFCLFFFPSSHFPVSISSCGCIVRCS